MDGGSSLDMGGGDGVATAVEDGEAALGMSGMESRVIGAAVTVGGSTY
jgi:hypothetical protein